MPLLLLGTARRVEARGVTSLGMLLDRIDRTGSLTVIELDRLSTDALADLITTDVGRPASGRLLAMVNERSGGNPFLARQTLLALRESGALSLGDEATITDDAVTLSLSRRQTLSQRVLRVSDDAWIVARVAALVNLPNIDRLELLADIGGIDERQARFVCGWGPFPGEDDRS